MTKTCPHCHAPFPGDRRSRYCPDCRDTSAPWRVDEVALERACAHLGIDVPVRVRRAGMRQLLGRYHGIRLLPEAPRDPAVYGAMSDEELNRLMNHRITVAVRVTPETASRTLWHELTHAAQYERDPDGYVEGYAAERREAVRMTKELGIPFARTYRAISFEIEARANEDLHYSRCSLTLPNRRVTLEPQAGQRHRVVAAFNGELVLGPDHARHEAEALRAIEVAKSAQASGAPHLHVRNSMAAATGR